MSTVAANLPTETPGLRLGPFWLKFLLLQFVLFALEMTQPVQTTLIQPFNSFLAQFSALLMQPFDSTVFSQGAIIWNTESLFGIEILAGCNAVEASILLFSAIIAFPAPLWHKIKGLVYGALAIHIANLLRIISLFYIGQWNLTAFEWAHLYVWQALIMIDAVVVWLIWIHKIPTPKPLS